MRLEYQIIAAVALDAVLGDPRWLPHPVRLMGNFALWLEAPMRKRFRNARMAGVVTAITVLLSSILLAWLLLRGAERFSPLLRDVISVLLIYTSIAMKDLAAHAARVDDALRAGDMMEARRRVSWMVGRDTEALTEEGVARAAVESVAENTVDGVTAPLFFAILAGPVGAVAYKAASTLDSTFGYKNERYLRFGWASARLDDALNFIPARLTAPLIAAAAWLLGLRWRNALRILRRDGRKHASPNSGLPEATMAGALGVRLGGPLYRKGKLCTAPSLGDPLEPLAPGHIRKVINMMVLTSLISLGLFLMGRVLVVQIWRAGMGL